MIDHYEWHLPSEDWDRKAIDLVVTIEDDHIEIGSRWTGTMGRLTPEQAREVAAALMSLSMQPIRSYGGKRLVGPGIETMQQALDEIIDRHFLVPEDDQGNEKMSDENKRPEHMKANTEPVTNRELGDWMNWVHSSDTILKSKTGNRMHRLICEVARGRGFTIVEPEQEKRSIQFPVYGVKLPPSMKLMRKRTMMHFVLRPRPEDENSGERAERNTDPAFIYKESAEHLLEIADTLRTYSLPPNDVSGSAAWNAAVAELNMIREELQELEVSGDGQG